MSSISKNYKITLQYLIASKFRIMLLLLFLLSILLLSLGDVDQRSEEEIDLENGDESIGTTIAFAVGVPLSILFTFIASIYYIKNRQMIKHDSKLSNWSIWSLVIILLLGVAPIIWALSGVVWFLFETSILALLFEPIIHKVNKNTPRLLQKHSFLFLSVQSIFFFFLTFSLYNQRSEIEVKLQSDSIYLEIMIGGFILILFTIWGYYYYWKTKQPNNLEIKLENLPLIFTTAMFILYFEVFKGLFKDSQITWVSNMSISIEFLALLVFFFVAIFNVTQEVMQYVDIELTLPELHMRLQDIKNPYNYILGIYVLYLSKFFYSDLLGIGFAFLYAAIVFTFLSIFVLNYRLKDYYLVSQR